MYKITLTFLFSFILLTIAFAQSEKTKYNKIWIQFTDKKDSPYSLFQPIEFLSQRAIDRRLQQGIPLEMRDIPVNPQYLQAVRATGATVYTTSKWFNGCTVRASNKELTKIQALPFVKKTEPTGKHSKKKTRKRKDKKREYKNHYNRQESPYGYGENQVTQLNGHLIHNMGFDGEGMLVAILDGGFVNVDIMPFFDSLRANNRLLQGWDFVDNDDWPFESSSHGSKVLSCMGANLPGLLVGTAPNATYVCLKTEDVRSEYPIEVDNWVAGIEYADSIGADVVNSSLGYTTFNDRAFNYTYKDMDGNTSRASIAADIAAGKGILVVNSAGNEGGGTWKYIGVPADGDSVLAIGAVDEAGHRVYFSSQGPSYDGDVKPNVLARGGQTVVGSTYGYRVDNANGTSFSSPVLAGMSASLWQAFPDRNSMDIYKALEKAGSNADKPNGKRGYGIPDFYEAFKSLKAGKDVIDIEAEELSTWISENLIIHAKGKKKDVTSLSVQIKNIIGEEVLQTKFDVKKKYDQLFQVDNIDELKAGVYFIEIEMDDTIYRGKLLKQKSKKSIRP